METYPDFTWEWIIQSCERFINEREIRTQSEFDALPEREKAYIHMANGLINIVPELKAHPQLEKLVPMKSMLGLRWFPASNYEVGLSYAAEKKLFEIYAMDTDQRTKFDVIERKEIPFDQVPDELYALIQKYRDDA